MTQLSLVTGANGHLGNNLDTVVKLPVDGLHVDLVRGPQQLDRVVDKLPADFILSAGVVNRRNIWANDLEATLDILEPVAAKLGPDRLIVAPSCSLMLVPIDLAVETDLDEEVRAWMAFAMQKLDELAGLDVEGVIEVISQGAAQSWQMNNRAETMIAGQFDFGFAVDWMRKDLGICIEESARNGAELPITRIVNDYYGEVQAMGGGRWDTSSLIRRLTRK